MSMAGELPTIRDELDRKTHECLERLVRHHALGKIGDEAMSVGIRAVWETVSGLASDDTSALATEMHREAQGHHLILRQTRTFRDVTTGRFMVSVSWQPGTCQVRILKGSGAVQTRDYDSEGDAKLAFERMGQALERTYEEW